MRSVFFFLVFLSLKTFAQDRWGKDIFIKVDLSKKESFVGEPIIVSYSLYTRLPSESKVVKRPGFKGFGVYDLEPPESGRSSTVSYKGESYTVYVLRKVQLYPLQSGLLILEPMEVENEIFLDDKINRFTVKTKPVNITIKDVPGKFSGAVGRFNIETKVNAKSAIHVNDIIELEVTIKGEGNFPMLTIPEIQWPKGIEHYEPKAIEAFTKTNVPISGAKTFIIPFLSKIEGQIDIPPITFRYFDPVKGITVTSTSSPIKLQVHKPQVLKQKDIRKPEKSYVKALLISLILIFPIVLVVLKKSRKSVKHQQKVQSELPQTPGWEDDLFVELKRAFDQKDVKQFYKKLNEGIDHYLYHRMGIEAENWIDDLKSKSGNSATTETILKLKERASLFLYSPYSSEEFMAEDMAAFNDLIG